MRQLQGVSVNAAMNMKHKLRHDMKVSDDSLALKGLAEGHGA